MKGVVWRLEKSFVEFESLSLPEGESCSVYKLELLHSDRTILNRDNTSYMVEKAGWIAGVVLLWVTTVYVEILE